MDLHLKTQPAADGMTRVVEMTARDLVEPKRSRSLKDLASLVAYLKKWGDPTLGTIYWTPASVIAVLNEEDLTSGKGEQDTVTFNFERPFVAREWLKAINGSFSHKKFKEFLETRYQDVDGGAALYTKISNLSLAQTFSYDGKLEDDHNYQIAFKTEAGGDVANLPKTVTVNIPLINGLEKPYRLDLKLKMTIPKAEGATPTFEFVWEDQETVLEQAARDAVAEIETQLGEWLVVFGKP